MLCKYLYVDEGKMCEKIHAIMAWETLYFPSFFFYHNLYDHGDSCCFSSQDLVNLVQSNVTNFNANLSKYIPVLFVLCIYLNHI